MALFPRSSMIIRAPKAPERSDVSLYLRKWWVSHHRQDGLITKTLSPFEQNIVSSLFANMPNKVFRYLKRWSVQMGPAFVTLYGAMRWADWKFEQLYREEWD